MPQSWTKRGSWVTCFAWKQFSKPDNFFQTGKNSLIRCIRSAWLGDHGHLTDLDLSFWRWKEQSCLRSSEARWPTAGCGKTLDWYTGNHPTCKECRVGYGCCSCNWFWLIHSELKRAKPLSTRDKPCNMTILVGHALWDIRLNIQLVITVIPILLSSLEESIHLSPIRISRFLITRYLEQSSQ